MIIPVNDNKGANAGGTHWSLLCYQKSSGLFSSYDSVGDANQRSASRFKRAFENVMSIANTQPLRYDPVPRQVNGI